MMCQDGLQSIILQVRNYNNPSWVKHLVETWINTLQKNTTIQSSTSEFDGAPRREWQLRNVKGNILEWGNKVLPNRARPRERVWGLWKTLNQTGVRDLPRKIFGLCTSIKTHWIIMLRRFWGIGTCTILYIFQYKFRATNCYIKYD